MDLHNYLLKRLTGLLLIYSLTHCVQAQQKTLGWVPGFVVTNTGDTLRGEINNRAWRRSPDQITLRSPLVSVIYTVSDIQSFGIPGDNERYIRLSLRLDRTPLDIDRVQQKPDILWEEATVFALKLVDGPLSLYTYEDNNSKVHFIVQRIGEQPQDLILLRYQAAAAEIVTISHYQQQLKSLTADCATVQLKSARVDFGETSLTNLVETYNACVSKVAPIIVRHPKGKSRLEWGAHVGMLQTRVAVRADLTQYTSAESSFQGTPSPTIGVWLNAYFTRNRNVSFYVNLYNQGYTVQPTQGAFSEFLGDKWSVQYLKLLTALNWTLPVRSALKPYILVGMSNGIGLKIKVERATGEAAIDKYLQRQFEQAFVGAFGLRYRRCSFEGRYEIGNGTASTQRVSTVTSSVGLLAGMRF